MQCKRSTAAGAIRWHVVQSMPWGRCCTAVHQEADPVMEVDLLLVRHQVHLEVVPLLGVPGSDGSRHQQA
jgi:hypothetical protein